MVEADLVVQPGRDQGQHQGHEVDEDGDTSRSERQHPLDLDPLELGKIISRNIITFVMGRRCQEVVGNACERK